MGPWIVAARDGDGRPTLDPHELSVTLRLNGKVMQNGHTGQMIFSDSRSVAYLSRLMTLLPGDVIMTGTPAGVGVARDRRYLQPGDVVEIEIEGIGVLRNPGGSASCRRLTEAAPAADGYVRLNTPKVSRRCFSLAKMSAAELNVSHSAVV